MRPSEVLQRGSAILDPALAPHGFRFTPIESGSSSGGEFASGIYSRGDRRLGLHFRHSLGMVVYYVGQTAVAHEHLMRALLGRAGGNQYPGFSDDPLDGFRHLRHDLQHFGGAFLSGSDEEFCLLAQRAAAVVQVGGFKSLSRS